MVNPLESFAAQPHPLGGEVELTWRLPAILPAAWKLYIFKRLTTNPTDQEITDYFTWLFEGTGTFNYNGLFVFTSIKGEHQIYSDFGGREESERLKDGSQYYYKASIYNPDNGEHSTPLAANAIPNRTVKIHVLDGKELVAQAIMRVMDGQKSETGQRVNLRKYIEVVKHLPTELVGKSDFILISRASGETRYNFMNSYIAEYKANILKGEIDVDLIEGSIYTIENPDRRDVLINILRGYKQYIKRYCIKQGAIEALVSVGEDSRDPTMNNANLAVAHFHVALLTETQVQISGLDLDQVVSQPTFS